MSRSGAGLERPGPEELSASVAPRLRPALDTDGDGLVALVGGCFAEYDGCVLDTEHEMPHLLRVASHFAAAGGRAWVAEADGVVVASVGCRPAPGRAGLELQMLYVAAPWRRRGIGAGFVGLVEAEARRRAVTLVELWSDTRFTDAHRLYRSLGYEQLPETRELHDLSDTVEFHFVKKL
jgi:putative acetyltransferase